MSEKINKICVVCGDIAIARNFGAYTCKSCKPFFRRNASKIFKCKNEGKCQINRLTRKKCRKCRLDKCFAVGMRKEMILDEVEKHFRRSLVEINRKLKQNGLKVKSVKTKREDPETYEESLSESTILTQMSEMITENNIEFDSLVVSEIGETFAQINLIESNQNQELMPLNQLSCHLSPSYSFINYDNNFTNPEEYKLRELFQVFRPVVNCLNKKFILFDIKDIPEMVKTGNYFYEREINNFVKAIKKMRIIEDMDENDRIALVKYSCRDILCLRAIQCYDTIKDSWIVSVDDDHALSMSLSLFTGLKLDVYTTYKNHLIDIINECDSDSIILDLLSAIALFNPSHPNIINREIVREQQQLYMYLLQRYLTFKYRTKYESDIKSEKLRKTLINARILGELDKKCLFQDYQEYGPLIKEVFDL